MKNFLLFLLFFSILSCGSNKSEKKPLKTVDCPITYFAAEHKNYVFSEKNPINIDNLSFKADLNNFSINDPCLKYDDYTKYSIDILIIISPLDMNNSFVNLPIYAASVDENNNVIDIQYYSIEGNVDFDEDSKTYIETEIFSKIMILSSENKAAKKIIIGFMMDAKTEELLN